MSDKVKWKPSKDFAERAVLHFVRWYKGLEVVQTDEKVKGWTPDGYERNEGGSRSFKPKSEVTFPKHHELSDEDYMRLVTLQKHKEFVLKLLDTDLDYLHREETDPRYRMPYKAAKRLDRAYGIIATEFKFYEQVRIRRSVELTPDEWEAVRTEAKKLGISATSLLSKRAANGNAPSVS
jgi:hypothetical protein